MAEAVSTPHADERQPRRDPGEKCRGGRRAAPVMRHLQDVRGEAAAARNEVALGQRLDVARQESRAPRERDGEDERAVVLPGPRVRAVPRMKDVERETRGREALACAEALQRQAPAGGRFLELVEKQVARRAAGQNDAFDRKRCQNREKAPRVIGVRVRKDDRVKRHGSEVGEARQEAEAPEIVRAVGTASSVDENTAPGRDQQPRVSLADVEGLNPDRLPRGDDGRREDDGDHDCRPGEQRRPANRRGPREARREEESSPDRDPCEGGRRHDPHRMEPVERPEKDEKCVRQKLQRENRERRRGRGKEEEREKQQAREQEHARQRDDERVRQESNDRKHIEDEELHRKDRELGSGGRADGVRDEPGQTRAAQHA